MHTLCLSLHPLTAQLASHGSGVIQGLFHSSANKSISICLPSQYSIPGLRDSLLVVIVLCCSLLEFLFSIGKVASAS